MQQRPDEADSPTRLEDAGELCRRFERLWRQGDRPRIEEYLSGVAPDEQLSLLERLLTLEWALREAARDDVRLESYLHRFADQQDTIRSLWSAWRERAAGPGDPTRFASASQEPPAKITLPSRLGRYENLRLIGQGGMGVVFEGFDSRLKRLVAIKMINAAVLSPQWVTRFAIEAEALARVQHPHIVQIHDWDEYDGQPYLVMEYVPGGSLEDRLRDKPMAPREAARLVAILARAVQHAHAAQVVHRDLKPANVLLAPALEGDPGNVAWGRPKISDFGLARMTWDESLAEGAIETREAGTSRASAARDGRSQTATGVLMGTPAYVSPEQAACRAREVGPPADVWALGVILYRCLTGRLPFDADTGTAMLEAVQFAAPRPMPPLSHRIPLAVSDACLCCLEKEPKNRPLARVLAERLEAFVQTLPAGDVTTSPSVPRSSPRPPSGLKGAVLIEVVQEQPAPSPAPMPSPAPAERERPPRIAETQEVRRCPGCGRSAHASSPRCTSCGTRLIELKPGFATPPPVREEEPDYEEVWEPDLRRHDVSERSSMGLILGLLALGCGLLSFVPGVCVLGFVFGSIGWLINHDDLSRMRRGLLEKRGRPYSRYGLWCSISGLLVSLLAAILWVGVILSSLL